MRSFLKRLWRSRPFKLGLLLLAIGSGPLLMVIALASLGFTKDPNPNPVMLGILAFLTFWPSVILMLVGVASAFDRKA